MPKKKTILVAPLNWGLGHATRCIPIICGLLTAGFNVILASDGASLLLLKKEFPELDALELPSYNITYPKKGNNFKWHMLLKLPFIWKPIAAEKKIIAQLVAEGKIQGIISDNRLGARNAAIPSVCITHQVNVLSGNTTYWSSKLHQKFLRKFDAVWVPDFADTLINLSGKLGHSKGRLFPIEYLGPLSRMKKKKVPISIEILAILSGPEPQRALFEQRLIPQLRKSEKSVLLVRGVVENEQKWKEDGAMKIVNFMTAAELEAALNTSDIIISRPGYTTIMDLVALQKKSFFVPTPGQYEQEYLAKRLKFNGIVPSCEQEKFNLAKLNQITVYKGLKIFGQRSVDFAKLFSLFEGN